MLEDALRADPAAIRIISPFIKEGATRRLLKQVKPKVIQVVTRFNLRDFSEGVSDLSALQLLLKNGAQIRGVRNLHAKLYLFGIRRAVVTSANLTEAALSRNHELGFVAEEPEIVDQCRQYFDSLWNRAGQNLQDERLADWKQRVNSYLQYRAPLIAPVGLGDEGVSMNELMDSLEAEAFASTQRNFRRGFGNTDPRRAYRQQAAVELSLQGSEWLNTRLEKAFSQHGKLALTELEHR